MRNKEGCADFLQVTLLGSKTGIFFVGSCYGWERWDCEGVDIQKTKFRFMMITHATRFYDMVVYMYVF